MAVKIAAMRNAMISIGTKGMGYGILPRIAVN
jgi:hypothetical protein